MADQEVIIDIKLSDEEASKAIAEATVRMQELKEAQKELQKAYKNGLIDQQQYTNGLKNLQQGMKENKDVISANEKAIRDNAKAQKEAVGSLNQMRTELKSMLKEYDNLSKSERESAEVGGALLERIKAQTKAVSEAEEATGRFQRNVGNYKSAMQALPQPIKAVITGFNGIGAALKALIANPIVALIAAIVVVIKQLVDAFKRSDDAMTNLSVAFAAFQPIITAVREVLGKIAETIAKVAVGFANLATALLSKISPAFKQAKEDAQNYELELDRLEDTERQYTIESAKRSRDVAELRSKATQTDKYSAEQRIKFLNQAISLEQKDLEDRKKIAAETFKLAKQKAKQDNDTTDETKNRLAELEAAMIKAEEEYFTGTRRLQSQLTSAINEEMRAEQERAKAAVAAAKERRAKELDAARQLEDAIIAVIIDNETREKEAARVAGARKVEDLKKRLKEETNLNAKARADINALIVLTEQQTQAEVAKIDAKYRAEEKAAEEKAAEDSKRLREKEAADEVKRIKDEYAQLLQARENALEQSLMSVQGNIVEIANLQLKAAEDSLNSLLTMDADTKAALYDSNESYTKAVIDAQKRVNEAQKVSQQAPLQLASNYLAATRQITSAMNELFNAIGSDNERMQGFLKAIALANIAVSTAQALAEAIKAGAGAGGFPANLAAIAAGVAAVLGGIASATQVLNKATTPAAPKFATGGFVEGAGTETSDSINARLSNGEYVLSAKTTRKVGVEALDRLNFGRSVPQVFKSKFASGGLVSSPTTRAAREVVGWEALQQLQPVVSVKEITRVANRVRVKETISKN